MKLEVKELSYGTKPKQTEGKVVVRHTDFSVKPKPTGVILVKNEFLSVFKTDSRSGVILQKERFRRILKQND